MKQTKSPADERAELVAMLTQQYIDSQPTPELLAKQARLLRTLRANAMHAAPTELPCGGEEKD